MLARRLLAHLHIVARLDPPNEPQCKEGSEDGKHDRRRARHDKCHLGSRRELSVLSSEYTGECGQETCQRVH